LKLKKIMSISLVFTMVAGNVQPVLASSISSETILCQEENTGEKYDGVLIMEPQIKNYDTTEVTSENHKEIIVSEEYAKSQMNSNLRYGESEVSQVLDQRYVTKTVTPEGQLPGGSRFPSTNSGFTITIEGGTTVSFSYSLPLSWLHIPVGTIGISIKPGVARTVVSGALVTVPNTTDYFRVKIDKTTLIQYVKVDCYQYAIYKYSYYTTWKTPYSNYYYCVKVI